MVSSHHPIFFFFFFFLVFVHQQLQISHFCTAASAKPTKLVEEVCNQTSDYAFCVDSLYTDPRTPDADTYTLAYISFGLAYVNATDSHDRILELLNKSSGARHERLEKCKHGYGKAVSALEQAFNDLNSETYITLSKLAKTGAGAAHDCQAALAGTSASPLRKMNLNLKGLCGICVAVSELLAG